MLSRLINFSLTHGSLVLLAAGLLLAIVAFRLPRTSVVVPAGYAMLHRVSAKNPNPQTKPKNNNQ